MEIPFWKFYWKIVLPKTLACDDW